MTDRRIRRDIVVVIPTLDRPDQLRSTIVQIASQKTLPLKVVIVDQGAAAHNEPLLFQPLVGTGVVCDYVRSLYRSVSAARNLGLFRSRPADIVLYLDDDVELLSDVIGEHARYYDEEPSTAAVAGHVCCDCSSRDFHRLNTFRPVGDYVDSGRGCHMSFRTSILRSIGGFNAYICNHGDETELFRRLLRSGYRIRNGRQALVKHLVAPNGGNRQVGVNSHANYGRTLRDGIVRVVKTRGLVFGVAWPLKNWRTLIGLIRTARGPLRGARAALQELTWGLRLARLSQARRDYVPLSVELSSGVGVDSRTGLPVV